jgi:hypothetical protein
MILRIRGTPTGTGTGDAAEADDSTGGDGDSMGDGSTDTAGEGDGDGESDTDGPEGGTGLLDCTDPMATVTGGGTFDGNAYVFSEVSHARMDLHGTPDAPCLDSLNLRVADGNSQLYVTVQALDEGGYVIDWMEFQEEGSVIYRAVSSDLEGVQPSISLGDMGDDCGSADFALAADSIRFLEANSDNPNFYDLTALDYTVGGEWMVEWTGQVCP